MQTRTEMWEAQCLLVRRSIASVQSHGVLQCCWTFLMVAWLVWRLRCTTVSRVLPTISLSLVVVLALATFLLVYFPFSQRCLAPYWSQDSWTPLSSPQFPESKDNSSSNINISYLLAPTLAPSSAPSAAPMSLSASKPSTAYFKAQQRVAPEEHDHIDQLPINPKVIVIFNVFNLEIVKRVV